MALSSFPASAILVKMPGDHDSVSLTTAENAAEALAIAIHRSRGKDSRQFNLYNGGFLALVLYLDKRAPF